MFNFWVFATPPPMHRFLLFLFIINFILGSQMRFVVDLIISLSLTIYELLVTITSRHSLC